MVSQATCMGTVCLKKQLSCQKLQNSAPHWRSCGGGFHQDAPPLLPENVIHVLANVTLMAIDWHSSQHDCWHDCVTGYDGNRDCDFGHCDDATCSDFLNVIDWTPFIHRYLYYNGKIYNAQKCTGT